MAASLTVQCSMTSSAIQPSFPPRTPGFRLSPQRSPAALIGTFVSAGTQQSGRAFASTIRRAVITCHGSESHSGKPVPHSHSHSHSHSHPQQVGNVPLSAQNNAEHVEIMHARDANLDSENGQRNQHKEMRKNSIVQLEITHTHKSHAHELHLHLRHPNMQKAMSEKGSSEASAGSYEGNGNGHHHRHHDHDHQHMHDHHHHAHHDDQDIERHSHSHSHLHKHSNEVPSKNNSSDSEGKHGHGSLEPGSRNTQKHNGGSITFAVSSQWRPRNEPMERGAGAGKVLFVDAYTAGVAGDMMVAALLDLGVPWEVLADGLQHLGLGKCRCEVIPTERSAIVATRFIVKEDSPQPFRDYSVIQQMLEHSGLPASARGISEKAFRLLAEAEAAVHGVDVDSVHFHEVGAVDSIIDIVAASLGLAYIGASRIVVSPLPIGRGIIRGAAHGPLPSPAPATLGIICRCQLPTFDARGEGELVTPTGACIVGAVAEEASAWCSMRPLRTSYGAGTKVRVDRPNLLRLVLGDPL